VYRHLLTSEYHEADGSVIDIAVSHCEILKSFLSQKMAEEFLRLGIITVERNQGVLNKCLELFSRLLSIPHSKVVL